MASSERRATREVARFSGLSKSSHEHHLPFQGRGLDAILRLAVREAFDEGRGVCGYGRFCAVLAHRGLRLSERRARCVIADEAYRPLDHPHTAPLQLLCRDEGHRSVVPNPLFGKGCDGRDLSTVGSVTRRRGHCEAQVRREEPRGACRRRSASPTKVWSPHGRVQPLQGGWSRPRLRRSAP